MGCHLLGSVLLLMLGTSRSMSHGGGLCSSSWDCALAGECVEGRCACDSWATGSDCSSLHLAAAQPNNGLQLPGYHSWGGHCVRGANGTYHGYFSFMLGGCTLASWKTNSAILHATAESPEGPYTPAGPSVYSAVAGVMIAPWAHGAFIAFDPVEGVYLLWHIGPANTPSSDWKNCSHSQVQQPQFSYSLQGPQDKSVQHTCHTLNAPPPCGETFYVSTSKSVAGPWSNPVRLPLTARALNQSWWASPERQNNPSMPAPYIFENGTTLLYYQATSCPAGWGNLAPACIGVLRAPHWRGPYDLLFNRDLPIVHPESEDPTVFKTARGFHLLTNVNTYHKRCGEGQACGGHAWSHDGITWSQMNLQAFGPVITLDNGTTVRNSYVERPQVYMQGGVPHTFFLGLTRPDGYSDSVTWAQRFCQPNDTATVGCEALG